MSRVPHSASHLVRVFLAAMALAIAFCFGLALANDEFVLTVHGCFVPNSPRACSDHAFFEPANTEAACTGSRYWTTPAQTHPFPDGTTDGGKKNVDAWLVPCQKTGGTEWAADHCQHKDTNTDPDYQNLKGPDYRVGIEDCPVS